MAEHASNSSDQRPEEEKNASGTTTPKPAAETRERSSQTAPSNHVFVGKKPVMSYAMSAMIQLAQSEDIVLKARGMVMSTAVDVAEVITKRLGNNAFDVKDIKIDTEIVGEGADTRNVSTIEILVGKK